VAAGAWRTSEWQEAKASRSRQMNRAGSCTKGRRLQRTLICCLQGPRAVDMNLLARRARAD